MPVRIRKSPLACCIAGLSEYGLVPPDHQSLARIIEADPDFTVTLNRFYCNAKGGGLDTDERHILLDMIGIHFVGRAWPINHDTPSEHTAFMRDIMHKAIGWTFDASKTASPSPEAAKEAVSVRQHGG